MLIRKLFTRGGIEFAVGTAWMTLSLIGWAQGRAPGPVLLIDFASLLALLVTVLRPTVGLGIMVTVIATGFIIDPVGAGMSHYIALCALVACIRQGLWRSSLIGTAVFGTSFIVTTLRRASEVHGYLAPIISDAAVLLVAWLIGLGFRWIARLEAERVTREYTARQVQMAVDIHDFVGRNLTALLLRAEAATPADLSDPEILGEAVARLKQASTALRSVTDTLQQAHSAVSFSAPKAIDALGAGIRELRAVGIEVNLAGDATAVLNGLSPDLDLVVSRVISEALHNVAKHADKTAPCHVTVAQNNDTLEVTVRNRTKRSRTSAPLTLGLAGMERHAELVGGIVHSARQGDGWLCTASLPRRTSSIISGAEVV
ncbi:sensor histidine kinase [Tessaracoccus caeni]|uniref:sensor histidine kinase n=1 Tax=Tessaracoccus caeni TaxID=3031239 RepID=UPI0023DAE7CF|nr:hypothetical protein [Tessaracoccus caeni]MDF1488269.1 hypothetical protein [Tessaracoccus caeni]